MRVLSEPVIPPKRILHCKNGEFPQGLLLGLSSHGRVAALGQIQAPRVRGKGKNKNKSQRPLPGMVYNIISCMDLG